MSIRVGTAALGLLLVGVTGYPAADARTPVVGARIDAPAGGAQVDGVVEIRGRATVSGGGRFAFYRILIDEGRTPVAMRPLGPRTTVRSRTACSPPGTRIGSRPASIC